MKTLTAYSFYFLVLLLPATTVAQTYTIRGTVVNGNDSLTQGEIVVTDALQETLLGTTLLEKGKFSIAGIRDTQVVIKIAVWGTINIDTSITVLNKNGLATIDLGIIRTENATQLDEATILARKPMFEKTAEGSRINVENTMLASSVNAAELLGKTPGITIAGNKINVFGRGEAMIILNGKEIPFETFKSLPPGEISSIEMITNPSAKYDAKGKAVVIVTLKKGYLQGLQATLTESGTIGFKKNENAAEYLLNAANLNLNFRQNKFNLTTYYAHEAGTTWSENIFTTKILAPAGIYTTDGHYKENSTCNQVHTYRMGLSYDFNSRSYLSAQYDGLYHYFTLDVEQNSAYRSPLNEVTNIRMNNDGSTTLINHSANLNYALQLDSTGASNLFIGAQYNSFENQLSDHITENISRENDLSGTTWNRVNDGNSLIHLYTLQADLVKKMKKATIETGLKYAQTTNAGRIRFLSKASDDDTYTENPALAKGNLYTEMIPAAYFILKGRHNKWSWNAGLRAEYSDVTGYSKQLDRHIIDSSYFNVFPNAKISQRINDKWGHSLSYAHKINRPVYQDLDPFLWYLDSLTSIQGNPRLIPELLHQLEYVVWLKSISMKLAYTHSKNTIWAITQTGASGANSVVYIKENIRQRNMFTASVDIPFESKHYITYNSIAVNFFRFSDNRPQYKVSPSTPLVYIYSYHQFILGKGFNADLSGEFYGASSDGFARKEPYYYVSAGVSGSFLKDKLNVQLMFNDVLRSARWAGVRTIGTFVNTYNQRANTHFFRISLSFKFGALRNFGYNNKMINEKEFGRIKK